ncbi:hypothetical protein Ancab_014468 [Ancistrocladus abbreviatus]
MKRELAFALEGQSQILDTVGKTRSNKVSSVDYNAVPQNRGRKRMKRSVGYEHLVECSVTQVEEIELLCDGRAQVVDNFGKHGENSIIESLEEEKLWDVCVESLYGEAEVLSNGVGPNRGCDFINNVQNTTIESPEEDKVRDVGGGSLSREAKFLSNGSDGASLNGNCDLINSSENNTFAFLEEKNLRDVVVDYVVSLDNGTVPSSTRDLKKLLPEKPLRRFTRSALKPNVDAVDESSLGTSDSLALKGEKLGVKNPEAVPGDNVEVDEDTPSISLEGKLELKMTKKVALSKIPKTVRELLETGLLEECHVYYNHGKKGPVLRGKIKGVGILCFCGLCRGYRVVAPSIFEIHACNSYRRAAQYICLENGRSFIQILHACKNAKGNALDAVIQNAIGPLSSKETVFCQSCKGPLSRAKTATTGLVCNSCVKADLSPGDTEHTVSEPSGSPKSAFTLKSSKSASASNTLRNRSCSKVMEMSSERASATKLQSPQMGKQLRTKSSRKVIKLSRKSILKHELPRSSGSSLPRKTPGKITKKDLRMHKLVFEEGGLPDGTELGYYGQGKRLLNGYKKGHGIFCLCCNSVVSASQFEAHAGCASKKKPYCYIYTSNGVSLHELSISLACNHSFKDSDDLCIICADGGNLVVCDLCPRVFHPECASLHGVPRGKWYCQYCQNMFEREKFVAHNANAVAAGRVSGVDPIEEINKRCIRIVKDFEADVTSCALCSGFDFSKSGFGSRTILFCDQCEKEYHVGCLKEHKLADLKELPKGNWFCSTDCLWIHSTLQSLLVRGAEKLPAFLVNVIRKKHVGSSSENVADLDVSWMLINGRNASVETKRLLSQAIAIFHDGFSPIIDGRTGRDLIPAMVYGRNLRGIEYKGMYCALLTLNSVVVSAAVFRVFGAEIVELPLVATIDGSRGKGYFQTLFGCIERLFAFLNVRSIVLPAAEEAQAIWTDKFGFRKMTPDEVCSCRKIFWPMVAFQGTVMLQKKVPGCRIVNSC